MAVVALHSAATGLNALSQNIDIIANNLANANTTGFKTFRANFEDLMYLEKAQPGVENANGDQRPAGLFVGLGTRIANTQVRFEPGSPIPTDGDLDMMIDGTGFFAVDILDEDGNGIGYTRAGNFFLNAERDVVLGNSDGPRLEPNINIPEGVTNISVSADGFVTGLDEAGELVEFGQITLWKFPNQQGLRPLGNNIYVQTVASGDPIEGVPREGGFGGILHKFLESSNVDPVRELVELIKTQRTFEMNSQSIQAADEALQVIGNLRRG